MNRAPNTFYALLAVAAIVGLALYPAFVITADHAPAQFGDASENITSYPAPDTPWYAVGAMPVFVFGAPLAVLLGVLAWEVNITRLRRYKGE